MTKHEFRRAPSDQKMIYTIRASSFGILSSFGFRHSSLELASANARRVSSICFERRHDCFFTAESGILHALDCSEHPLVIVGHDLDKFRSHLFPKRQDLERALAAGVIGVAGNHLPDQ